MQDQSHVHAYKYKPVISVLCVCTNSCATVLGSRGSSCRRSEESKILRRTTDNFEIPSPHSCTAAVNCERLSPLFVTRIWLSLSHCARIDLEVEVFCRHKHWWLRKHNLYTYYWYAAYIVWARKTSSIFQYFTFGAVTWLSLWFVAMDKYVVPVLKTREKVLLLGYMQGRYIQLKCYLIWASKTFSMIQYLTFCVVNLLSYRFVGNLARVIALFALKTKPLATISVCL